MGQLATAQWVSILTIIFAVTIFILRHIKWDWRKDQEHSLVKMGVRTGPA